MCGIAGYYGNHTEDSLKRMGDALAHRGPDAHAEITFDTVGLAHRRLAVMDLCETGVQPMTSANGRFTIVFNGEIYNHKELKDTYLASHPFKGTSDTEVLLELFAKIGIQAFSFLRGMYAFAIYDTQKSLIYLVRDPLGKKPLYWAKVDDVLLFGSEIKALKQHPKCPKAIDHDALAQYLMFEYIPAPRTIFQGVQKLHAGHYLMFDGEEVSIAPFVLDDAEITLEQDVEHQFEKLFDAAVRTRLVADVPVGVFLSGGLDSSAVAYFAQKNRETPIKTFSVGFTDRSFDEQADARLVAKHLGTDHHDLLLGTREIVRLIKELPIILDEPMGDSSIIPTALVSEFARQQVTVCLSGDGADELFHGYSTFLAHRFGSYYEHVPKPLRALMKAGAEALPVSHAYMSFDFKLKRFLAGFDERRQYRNAIWQSSLLPAQIERLTDGALSTKHIFEAHDQWYQNETNFARCLDREYREGYLTEDILVKADRASMHNSLELRSPFLDESLCSFASMLPERYKLRGREGKFIIKKVMSKHLPREIVWKRKKGFNIPIGSLIMNEMRQEFTDVLLNGPLVSSSLFKRDQLAILLNQHTGGIVDHRKAVWTLYVLARWMDIWTQEN